MDSRKLWLTVLGELETTVSRAQFQTWFKDTDIISQEDGQVVIAVPNIFARRWLKEKYHQEISASLTRALNRPVSNESINYKVLMLDGVSKSPTTGSNQAGLVSDIQPKTAPTPVATEAPASAQAIAPRKSAAAPTNQVNPRYTFENFVVGDSNDLAYASAQAVARYPGEKYKPLFFYGGVGLGKTHLMHAVGNEILRTDPTKRIRYVTSEQFTREFLEGIQNKRTKSFASLYRNLDVLIVDDIQFLGSKEKTQEEFFHTFNTLHEANKQIVLSSDKHPKLIPHLEARLRSRFEGGMIVDIQRPDLETRTVIAQKMATAAGADLPLDLVEYLARHHRDNIRELEGALSQLIAYCELRGIAPSVEVAKGLDGGSRTPRRRTITPKSIIEKTAAYFDLRPEDITGKKRDRSVVVPRQIAMYLIREELGTSFPQIGSAVGGRDHSTAMHSVEKIEGLLETDDDIRSEVNQLKERITA